MIRKTVKDFRRMVNSGEPTLAGSKTHIERVCRDTWWLLGFIPLYSRDVIVATSI